ncbi:fimbrial protein [Serratia fonticola]|uniref:fimbrial protein n=1 Tax=Serratia fonticola TaxID=47917 RepID=UPI0027E7ECAE|nr:fimbrial protein [Serratia fonticola]MDQ7208333.1 fimbrial protein [Serratia fonticola]HBE9078755.1 type 1 fimbrial protein [Serratia fonticola]HBE9089244.1 type 1 fimbrial protein [Serratia fonticola]HBE9151846.1 type 1 fimbrial protein [Serratia fonticola]
MKGINKVALALLVMAAGYNVASAAPLNINITGTVISSPCTVNNSTDDLNVSLGNNIQAASLATAGSGSTPSPFNLTLTSCPTGTSNVTVTFSGTADAIQTNMYKNTGLATPLAVELSSGATILGNTSTLTQPVQADKTVTYALSARAVTASGNVMPGSISAVVQANFTYN